MVSREKIVPFLSRTDRIVVGACVGLLGLGVAYLGYDTIFERPTRIMAAD